MNISQADIQLDKAGEKAEELWVKNQGSGSSIFLLGSGSAEKKSGSGSDLKSKREKNIFIF